MRRILTRTIVKMAVDGISLIVPRFNVSLVVSRMNNSLMIIVSKGTFALNRKFSSFFGDCLIFTRNPNHWYRDNFLPKITQTLKKIKSSEVMFQEFYKKWYTIKNIIRLHPKYVRLLKYYNFQVFVISLFSPNIPSPRAVPFNWQWTFFSQNSKSYFWQVNIFSFVFRKCLFNLTNLNKSWSAEQCAQFCSFESI